MSEDKWKDNFRPDGTRWACPYCSKCIEGSFGMMLHIQQEHPGIVQHKVVKLD